MSLWNRFVDRFGDSRREIESTPTKKRVLYTIGLQLLLSFAFAITAFVASSACYLVDSVSGQCVAGASHVFFSVSRGETFQIGTAALLFFGHALWALSTLRKGTSSVTLGMLLGSSAVVTLVACSTSALWGSLSSTLNSLDCAKPDELPRPNNLTTLKCTSYSTTFSALSVLGSLIFLTQGAITAMIYMWQAEFVGFESTGDIYESIATSSSPASRHHPFEPLPQGNDEESSAMTASMTQSLT